MIATNSLLEFYKHKSVINNGFLWLIATVINKVFTSVVSNNRGQYLQHIQDIMITALH